MNTSSQSGIHPKRHRVLCVDDEPLVLEALKLNLQRQYEVVTFIHPEEALEKLQADNHAAVVISDLDMPGMDGIAFLAGVQQVAPLATRILLTGHANLEAVVAAVNAGQIFRFLVKPWSAPALLAAVTAAAEQHRLVTAERELLEQTLNGSIKAMMDVLALANPSAFGRANRIRCLAVDMGERLHVANLWQLEMAALLRQLGYISVPQETVEKAYYGLPLSEAEKEMIDNVPKVTEELLANIPRLESVRILIARCSPSAKFLTQYLNADKQLHVNSQILRLALDYDALELQGYGPDEVIATLQGRGGYQPDVFRALSEVRGSGGAAIQVREVPLSGLHTGMILDEDVKSASGLLLIAPKGYQITSSFLERVRHYPKGVVKEPLRVILPE
jgi:response regulator RpfG family c-di-GMP phosphodiesterase